MNSRTKRPEYRVALLLHCVSWAAPKDSYAVAPWANLCNAESSKVFDLYRFLCERDGIDDGEEFSYSSYFDFQLAEDEPVTGAYPATTVENLCNVIALVTGTPISMCRVIASEDNFTTCLFTLEPFTNLRQMELYENYGGVLDLSAIEKVRSIIRANSRLHRLAKNGGRLHSAQTFYHYAWRSIFYDQACVCLAVVLESLFSPYSQGELAHQISVNVARFMQHERPDLEETYRFVKQFYNIRSRLVHGGSVGWDEMETIAKQAFPLCGGALSRVLCDDRLVDTFSRDDERRKLLQSYIFGNQNVQQELPADEANVSHI